MYKVFYYDKAIILSEEPPDEEGVHTVQILNDRKEICRQTGAFFNDETGTDLWISGGDPDQLFRNFITCFEFVEAAGGLVSDAENRILFIKRFDMWDLPKGKVEKGENTADAAIREVEEETGVKGLRIVRELLPTYHIYSYKEKRILKKTSWYRMTTDFSGELKPQLKEDITEAAWLEPKQSKQALSKSYRSLYETLTPYLGTE